jgi:hypothetical protein
MASVDVVCQLKACTSAKLGPEAYNQEHLDTSSSVEQTGTYVNAMCSSLQYCNDHVGDAGWSCSMESCV